MKQVLIINAALRLPPGKLAAQAAHASVSAFLRASFPDQRAWLEDGQAKIVLRAADAAELEALYQAARDRGLPAERIIDAGRTVVPAGTFTCLGIGPAEDAAIDAVTGALKLMD